MNYRIEPLGRWLEGILGNDWKIWYDVAAVFLGVIALIAVFFSIRFIIRRINNTLKGIDGWRPVCWSMATWSAVTWLALAWCVSFHKSGSGELFIVLGLIGFSSLIGMIVYHIKRLRIVKGTGAIICNIVTGLIITPIAQFGIIAAVIFAVLALALLLAPDRIVIYR